MFTVTRDRARILATKLESLSHQTLEPNRFELVLCVNSPDDEALSLLEQAYPFTLKHVINQAPSSSAAARNACAALAEGEVLYLSDDDCVLEPGVLERHLNMQRQASCVAIGSIRFEDGASCRHWAPQQVHYWNVNGANTSMPRKVFERVGGFDERLTGYGGEDLLLGYRVSQLGVPFRALPEAVARHIGPDPARARNREKSRSAGRNAVRIARWHPELAFRLGVHPLLLFAKRMALAAPCRYLWRALDAASYDYEDAYWWGAWEERKHA